MTVIVKNTESLLGSGEGSEVKENTEQEASD